MKGIYVVAVLCHLLCLSTAEDHYIRLLQSSVEGSKTCLIIADHTVKTFKGYKEDSEKALFIKSRAAQSSPADAHLQGVHQNGDKIIEIYGRDKGIINAHINLLCKTTSKLSPLPPAQKGAKAPEIIKIVDGGDPANRIDVVFMGDGYTASERDEFFEDMDRLTKEMFEGETFRSYLPVFNIWAIYVESVYSGIGYNNGPEDTPFELYREAGELRAIYPGNTAYARQVCQLTGTAACDYPSMIGNDDFYGGLGGEFVISTRSNRTGTVVLRHEMGHNFVDVGEEYDNGYVYSGVNAASSVASLGWTSWLSGTKKEERAIYRLAEYPWKDLSEGSVEYEFTSDGTYSRWYLIVSVSAAGEAGSLEFILDGEPLIWTSSGFDDREFYSWYGSEGLTEGKHTFSVASLTESTNPNIPRMIASINLHEFGNEEEYHADNDYVSAYPTWDAYGRKSFRPTNAGCLMRNMTHASFCDVCKEGMWYQFLQRISLIDNLVIEAGTPISTVTVATLPLGQLRDPAQQVPGEKLEVSWFLNGVEQEDYKDLFTISAESGSWRVEVKFVTPEVRSDPDQLLTDSQAFTV